MESVFAAVLLSQFLFNMFIFLSSIFNSLKAESCFHCPAEHHWEHWECLQVLAVNRQVQHQSQGYAANGWGFYTHTVKLVLVEKQLTLFPYMCGLAPVCPGILHCVRLIAAIHSGAAKVIAPRQAFNERVEFHADDNWFISQLKENEPICN